jgi:hypothetical protein
VGSEKPAFFSGTCKRVSSQEEITICMCSYREPSSSHPFLQHADKRLCQGVQVLASYHPLCMYVWGVGQKIQPLHCDIQWSVVLKVITPLT